MSYRRQMARYMHGGPPPDWANWILPTILVLAAIGYLLHWLGWDV